MGNFQYFNPLHKFDLRDKGLCHVGYQKLCNVEIVVNNCLKAVIDLMDNEW